MHPLLTAFLAQTAPEAQRPSAFMTFLPFIAIAFVFYFVFFRPQQRQQKQHATFLGGLKKGDEVVTNSGIIGRVVEVQDRAVTLDIGAGNKIRVLKSHIGGAWVERPVAAEPAKAEGKK
jgi:preprotein translocase subunit YajC